MTLSLESSAPKASTSTSSTSPTVAHELIHAVYELSCRKPSLGSTPSFTKETWPIYCDGYYTALCWAVRVMYGALEDRRRRKIRKQRAAALARGEAKKQTPTAPPPVVDTPYPAVAKVIEIPNKNAHFYRPAQPVRRAPRRAQG